MILIFNHIVIFKHIEKHNEEKTHGGQENGSQEIGVTNGEPTFRSTFIYSFMLAIGIMSFTHCLS